MAHLTGGLLAGVSRHALKVTGSWVGTPVYAFTPPSRINPIEWGTQPDPAYPGRGLQPTPIGLGNTLLDIPDDCDALIATPLNGGGVGGGIGDAMDPGLDVASRGRIGRVHVQGGRRVMIMGGDATVSTGPGFLFSAGPNTEYMALEGVRADFLTGPETDGIGIQGPLVGPGPHLFALGCHLKNLHGTYNAHDGGRDVASATVTGEGMLVATSPSAPTVLVPGQPVILAGASNGAFDHTWIVSGVGAGFITVQGSDGFPLPPEGSAAHGGRLWAVDTAALGIHADAVQGYSGGVLDTFFGDRNSFTGNYDTHVGGFSLATGRGFKRMKIYRTNSTRVKIAPQGDKSFADFLGDYDNGTLTVSGRGGRVFDVDYYERHIEGQAADDFTASVIPQQGRFVDGRPFGMLIERSGGRQHGYWPRHPLNRIRGVVTKGAPEGGDQAPWSALGGLGIPGPHYVSPGYAGKSVAAPPLADITLSGATYAADAARGAVIGLIDVPYEGGWDIDVTLLDDAGGKVQVGARRLQRGKTFYDGGPFDITLRARVRGTDVTFDKVFTITCTPVASPAYGALANPEAQALVRSLYSYASLTHDDLMDIDGFFSGLKAISGGGLYAKLRALFRASHYDPRDDNLNWIAPGGPELVSHGYPKDWTPGLGPSGNPTALFHRTAPGLTATALGLDPDSSFMMAGIAIRGFGVVPGALSTGTEYAAGFANANGDGTGGMFIGVSQAGAVVCRLACNPTRTSDTTPFAGTDGRMLHVALARSSSAGFSAYVSGRHGTLTLLRATVGSNEATPSHPFADLDIWVNGRNASLPNYGGRCAPYVAIGFAPDSVSEISAMRDVLDQALDYQGVT